MTTRRSLKTRRHRMNYNSFLNEVNNTENESTVAGEIGEIDEIENTFDIQFPDTTPAAFKPFDARLVGCNGDCGSTISQFIDHCVHQKKFPDHKTWNRTIKSAFYSSDKQFKLRHLLIKLMEANQIHTINNMYNDIYDDLVKEDYFIKNDTDVHRIKELIFQLSLDNHINILQELANAACCSSNTSLLDEIYSWFDRQTLHNNHNHDDKNTLIDLEAIECRIKE
eukprot:122331_1